MKIGILTFHRCINYGSYWQASCLAAEFRKRGHDAVILDHCSARINIAEWKNAMQPILPTPTPSSDQPFYRKKIENFFNAFEQMPLSAPFPLDDPSQMDYCDLVVIGSDEVWNLFHPWYGGHPVFYGEGIRAGQLISYGASFGNFDASWMLGKEWADKLRRFDVISVRDENSQNIIRHSLGFEPDIVPDPCLNFEPEYLEIEPQPAGEKYAAIYGHNFSLSLSRNVRKWADKRNLRLISIGYRNDWADVQWLTAGPLEFPQFIMGAEAVITNFFHGCIFALISGRPFTCEASDYRSNKIRDLMKRAGSEKHLFHKEITAGNFAALLNEPPGRKVLENTERLHAASEAWLDQAVGEFQSASNEKRSAQS